MFLAFCLQLAADGRWGLTPFLAQGLERMPFLGLSLNGVRPHNPFRQKP